MTMAQPRVSQKFAPPPLSTPNPPYLFNKHGDKDPQIRIYLCQKKLICHNNPPINQINHDRLYLERTNAMLFCIKATFLAELGDPNGSNLY